MEPLKFWTVDDFEISSFQFRLDERKETTHRTSGSDNTGLCQYTYNELGFRGDSIKKEGFKVMSLGCSNTEGVGVNNYETWPSQFTSHIPNGVNMNFGTGGRSNDFITRCLITYYDLVKPDLVLIMYTSPLRREIYTKDGGIEPFMPSDAWGYLKETNEGSESHENLVQLQNDNEDFINWYKNHLLIKYFLETKKCNWLWNGFFDIPVDYFENNRFDGDYGDFIDRGVDGGHSGPKHNKMYGKKLFDHVHQNFRDYLPADLTHPPKTLI
jgi:hypothetical protein